MARTIVDTSIALDSVIRNFSGSFDLYNNNCYSCVRKASVELFPFVTLPVVSHKQICLLTSGKLLSELPKLVKLSSYTRVNSCVKSEVGDIGFMNNGGGLFCFSLCVDENKWATKIDGGFLFLPDKNKVRSYRW